MKKRLTILLSVALLSTLCSCNNNAEIEALKKENEDLKSKITVADNSSQSDTSTQSTKSSSSNNAPQKYDIGEPITIQTEYGDYTISILGANKAKELNNNGEYPIIVSFEIENISYNYGDSNDNFSKPWSHFRSGMIVSDNDKNILKHFDISGPDEVHTPDRIPVGYKEKGSFAFFPTTANVMPSNIQVQISNENTEIGIVSLEVSN